MPFRTMLLEIDRYAIAAARALAGAVQEDYALRVPSWSAAADVLLEDLGGFYLDVLKDRLTTAKQAVRAGRRKRRSR